MGCIEVWESHQLELKKIDNQDLTDLTKRNVLKKMMPIDLQKDIERTRDLTSYQKVLEYVLEQIPLRRGRQETGSGKKKSGPDQDLDELDKGNEEEEGNDEWKEKELDTLEGSGKGFNGTCNHCGKYGHKKSECWTLDQEMKGKGKGKGTYKGGEKGKSKGKDGGFQPYGKGQPGGFSSPYNPGGWTTKGYKGKGKGKNGGNALYHNIDGECEPGYEQGGGYANGARFFLLDEAEDSEDEDVSEKKVFDEDVSEKKKYDKIFLMSARVRRTFLKVT